MAPERIPFQRLSRRGKIIAIGVVIALVAAAAAAAVLSGGSSGKSASETPASDVEIAEVAREVEEAEGEAAGDPTDPSEPRNLEEMIIARPTSEWAAKKQLEQQILTNAESTDPTHAHEASCSYGSSYRQYVHYFCQGYSLEGQGGIVTVEVTVDTSTGSVEVEPVY